MALDPNNLSSTAVVTFDDEFNTLSLWNGTSGTWNTNYWWGQANGTTLSGNGEQEWYIDSTYAPTASVMPWTVSNGVLTLTAAKASASIQPYINNYQYTSGMIQTYHSFSQTYGYFEMRAELPAGQGYWPAFWLLPENGSWPPELDVMEALGNAMTTLYTTVHTGQNNTAIGTATTVVDMSTGYHTYGVDWEPDYITWYFDGQKVFQTATPADMNQPMYMIANLAVGGYWPGLVDSSTPFPGQMHIDYIRAYEAAPSPPSNLSLFSLPTSGAWTDTILGTSRHDTLVGTVGNDYIDGRGNSDKMSGGAGDDTYVVDRPNDVVNEATNAGIDTVLSKSSSYTLPSNVENLKLIGTSSQSATGNALNNILTSNDYGSRLYGGDGNDILIAGRGADTLTGGAGNDIFQFNAIPKAAGHVTDFTAGVDMLDLRALFSSVSYGGTDPVKDGYLSFASDGAGGTRVYFDADGAGGNATPTLITTLDHVAPSTHIDWFFR